MTSSWIVYIIGLGCNINIPDSITITSQPGPSNTMRVPVSSIKQTQILWLSRWVTFVPYHLQTSKPMSQEDYIQVPKWHPYHDSDVRKVPCLMLILYMNTHALCKSRADIDLYGHWATSPNLGTVASFSFSYMTSTPCAQNCYENILFFFHDDFGIEWNYMIDVKN